MSDSPVPFENDSERQLRGSQDSSADVSSQVAGYVTQQDGVQALTGNPTGPYVLDVFRASEDGITGLVEVENGQDQRPATDLYGRIWVVDAPPTVTAAASHYTSAAAEQTKLIATGQQVIYTAQMIIIAGLASDRYLMLFDKATAPANNDVPIWRAALPNQGAGIGECGISFADRPIAVSLGLGIAISTTANVLTLPGAGQAYFMVSYRATVP